MKTVVLLVGFHLWFTYQALLSSLLLCRSLKLSRVLLFQHLFLVIWQRFPPLPAPTFKCSLGNSNCAACAALNWGSIWIAVAQRSWGLAFMDIPHRQSNLDKWRCQKRNSKILLYTWGKWQVWVIPRGSRCSNSHFFSIAVPTWHRSIFTHLQVIWKQRSIFWCFFFFVAVAFLIWSTLEKMSSHSLSLFLWRFLVACPPARPQHLKYNTIKSSNWECRVKALYKLELYL